MEPYNTFIERINHIQPQSFKRGAYSLLPDHAVRDKVSEDGKFKPFHGDTIIFLLPDAVNKELAKHQCAIYEVAGENLSERLDPDYFHMTLHDLSIFRENSAVKPQHYMEIVQLTTEILRGEFTIGMKSYWIFNMNNSSIVLGLVPADENAYNQLMRLYWMYEQCVPLPYPLTPHITLAYFKGEEVPAHVMLSLTALAEDLFKQEFIVPLDSKKLGYYHFSNMNQYDQIPCGEEK